MAECGMASMWQIGECVLAWAWWAAVAVVCVAWSRAAWRLFKAGLDA